MADPTFFVFRLELHCQVSGFRDQYVFSYTFIPALQEGAWYTCTFTGTLCDTRLFQFQGKIENLIKRYISALSSSFSPSLVHKWIFTAHDLIHPIFGQAADYDDMEPFTQDTKVLEDKIEDVSSDLQVDNTTKDEQNSPVWHVVRENPKVVFWCLFFAFSSVGW